jgi:hypothetical protein
MAHFNELLPRRYPAPPELAYRGRSVHNADISNFDPLGHPVVYRGHRSLILEKAYTAAKNPDALVPRADGSGLVAFIDRIYSEPRAADVKRLGAPPYRGGLVQPRDDWNHVNIAAMDFFLRQRWQPGTADAAALAKRPRPIVEWVNWTDTRWGVRTDTCRGRNALGLLLDVIADELLDGLVLPGAGEADWRLRQEELIGLLNSRQAGFADGARAPARQMSLF